MITVPCYFRAAVACMILASGGVAGESPSEASQALFTQLRRILSEHDGIERAFRADDLEFAWDGVKSIQNESPRAVSASVSAR
jgi:hypothetical protein